MKKTGLFAFISLITVCSFAQDWQRTKATPYDVVAPSTYGDPGSSDRIQGQIYYDVTVGAFKGINKNGTPDVLATSGSTAVTSGGAERVERVTFGGATEGTNNCTSSPCTIYRQSGSWITSVTRSSAGTYAVNIASGIFSATPTCYLAGGAIGVSNNTNCTLFGSVPTSTTLGIVCLTASSGTVSDATVMLACQGPR